MTAPGDAPLGPAPGALRVMSWNLHGGIGPDRRFDLERICRLIARHRPDILALQELDTRGRPAECLAPLACLTGPGRHQAQARTIITGDGDYGHALFSRWPFRRIELHDLSHRRHEPRAAIEAEIVVGGVAVHLVAAHLGLDIGERWRQARRLASLAAAPWADSTLMLGDFNDWFPFGSVRRTLAASLPVRTRLRTFPAPLPLMKLDRVYANTPILAAWTDPAARRCSDHLPVIADIALRVTVPVEELEDTVAPAMLTDGLMPAAPAVPAG
ncbi:endonuclease/exonuclease/phosphatase family protein [Ancylobacter sp. 6x-1]|uniref:Endonuclease/exonuclease/phosphatase family protein n=1 Tax=Ancylobacter crimeensis TaxID=2579147 RepID=A0ABT0D936_9HYPH|nr:endonuclease/exonuclease/phosphatase family protein [Ancylobacter crimeensis]MCK0196466.1 endonuclease/exonuclease/phosphatase family protein [Ancylobacter crimeensis]